MQLTMPAAEQHLRRRVIIGDLVTYIRHESDYYALPESGGLAHRIHASTLGWVLHRNPSFATGQNGDLNSLLQRLSGQDIIRTTLSAFLYQP